MTDFNDDQPWIQYRRLILTELERLGRQQETMSSKLDTIRVEFHARLQAIVETEIGQMRVEVAMLKVKAGVWGAIAGFIPVALTLAYFLLNKKP